VRRLTILSAILACLAVLAGAATVVSAALLPASPIAAGPIEWGQGTAAPCGHCDDCDQAPCPLPMTECLHVAAAPAPLLPAAPVELIRPLDHAGYWPSGDAWLKGLTPPPDPFPPRA